MRLAIKARQIGKPPYCHLCRKIIKYALKIQVPDSYDKKVNSPEKPPKNDEEKEKLIKILSYVDMNEAKPIRTGGRRGRIVMPKFKENIITEGTKWLIDQPDFNGMMNEFRFHEKTSKTTRGNPKNINEFFNYLVDEPVTVEEEDFETTCKIKDDDRIVAKDNNN